MEVYERKWMCRWWESIRKEDKYVVEEFRKSG